MVLFRRVTIVILKFLVRLDWVILNLFFFEEIYIAAAAIPLGFFPWNLSNFGRISSINNSASLSRDIGRAIFVSGGMVIIGFGVMMFAFEFPFIQRFGFVTVLDVVLVLLSTLVVMPALVLSYDLRRAKVKVTKKTPADQGYSEVLQSVDSD